MQRTIDTTEWHRAACEARRGQHNEGIAHDSLCYFGQGEVSEVKKTIGLLLVVPCLVLTGCVSGIGSYKVSGRIVRFDNPDQGVEGVELWFGDPFGTTKTNGNGYWLMPGLRGQVTVTPELAGWIFEPASALVTRAASDIDFIATAVGYTVSGRVTLVDESGLEGVVLHFSDGFDPELTDADGNWSKVGLLGVVDIMPEKDGWVFAPPSFQAFKGAADIDFLANPSQ